MSGEGHSATGGLRWLLTYADLITLLLAMFIVLYSISKADIDKFERLAGSLRRAFGVIELGLPRPHGPELLGEMPEINRDFLAFSQQLQEFAELHGLGGAIGINQAREGIVISLSSALVFRSGTHELSGEAREMLDQVASLLRTIPNEVRLEGHTDDISPYPRYATNWELSAARAVTVARYLIDEAGLDPARLSASAYADTEPLLPNDRPNHRAANRRVEILILYPERYQAAATLQREVVIP